MGVVSTIPEKCKRCYVCVRECPAKAIKVLRGQATVIAEQCIACGNCVKVCTQNAKRIEDAKIFVQRLLERGGRIFACLAPSFAVGFHPMEPGRVIAGLRRLGFTDVWEVAFGAELVSRQYARQFQEALAAGRYLISTPCPAIVSYVLKFMPELREALAPIASPMLATARAIRHRIDVRARIVFIGPCIAKKNEIRDPYARGTVDAVLTYEELLAMFQENGVHPEELAPGGFDGPACYLGRTIPISGGLLHSAGLSADILENNVLITEGKERVLAVLREIAEGRSRARLFDVLFCEGCINGPKMLNQMSVFARKELLADFIVEQNRHTVRRKLAKAVAEYQDLDLSRRFSEEPVVLPRPLEGEIEGALHRMKKFTPEDQLNCGSCGYPTCRDKAIAVCQGLAEPEMCLPYLVDELDLRLQQSTHELATAQNRLIHTERMASMWQISAGVAHEINNPLSTILLYSHTLLNSHRQGDPGREDLQMIASEAVRCRNIMRGLLDFARQSRVVKAPVDLAALIREAAANMAQKVPDGRVQVRSEVPPGMLMVHLDAGQIRQSLLNLVQNGIDAISGTGEVAICARLLSPGELEIRVRDNGCGIPKEHLGDVFTPFFTTKPVGKGTGIGLAIVYGVVKMHSGDISIESEVGQGTTFIIRLPVGGPKKVIGAGEIGDKEKIP